MVWGLLTFGNVGMLLWGAAAMIPLVIHLWQRRRPPETSWAAMDFLLAAIRKHSRRRQLEQWLLLATRMLLLGCFALALADPFLSGMTNGPVTSVTHHVLVVDTSYSMAFREGDRTLLQQTQDVLRKQLDDAPDGDSFSLVLMEQPPRVVLSDAVVDRATVRRELDRLEIAHRGASLEAALVSVEQLVAERSKRHPQRARNRIQFFTDLGGTTWNEATSPRVQELVERLAAVADLQVHEIGGSNRPNAAVVGLRADRSVVTPGQSTAITVDVTRFGDGSPLRLDLLLNGRAIDGRELALEKSGTQRVTFVQRFDAPGDQIVEARLSVDDLPLDNQRWLVIRVQAALQVLLIEGEAEAAEYVALALNPREDPNSPIQITTAHVAALKDDSSRTRTRLSPSIPAENLSNSSARGIARFDAIMLCNVPQVAPAEAAALYRFVANGGGLVVSLGDQVVAANYNRDLAAGSAPLLPAKLGAIERGEFFFDPLEYKHALAAPFRGRENSGLITVPTWRYVRLEKLETATAPTRVLDFNSGHPAVLETVLGQGRCLLVATALSPSSVERTDAELTPWSALPTWPSFPPLVHGLLHAAIRGRGGERNLLVGSRLSIPVPAETRKASLDGPNDSRPSLAVEHGVAESEPLARVGVYRCRSPGSTVDASAFAVNLDPTESDLRPVAHSDLPAAWQRVESAATYGLAALTGEAKRHWFRPILMVVVGLLLMEQLLAMLFARRLEVAP